MNNIDNVQNPRTYIYIYTLQNETLLCSFCLKKFSMMRASLVFSRPFANLLNPGFCEYHSVHVFDTSGQRNAVRKAIRVDKKPLISVGQILFPPPFFISVFSRIVFSIFIQSLT